VLGSGLWDRNVARPVEQAGNEESCKPANLQLAGGSRRVAGACGGADGSERSGRLISGGEAVSRWGQVSFAQAVEAPTS
jgi:hypothetical protein